MSETSIERRLKAGVEALGGRCIKLLTSAESGLPDRLVLLPGRRAEFVELKDRHGRLRPAQQRLRNVLAGMGWQMHVLNTNQRVDEWLENINQQETEQ